MKNKQLIKIRNKIIDIGGIIAFALISIMFIPFSLIIWIFNNEKFSDSNPLKFILDSIKEREYDHHEYY